MEEKTNIADQMFYINGEPDTVVKARMLILKWQDLIHINYLHI